MPDRLVEHVAGPRGLVLRRWQREDAAILSQAIADSLEHLRPWMPWVAQEPIAMQERLEQIDRWEREWLAGGDNVMGVLLNGSVAGGCGLHRRIGPGGLEIGYWTHPSFLRQGIASTAAKLLTDAAFADPQLTRVEIHHDKANEASAGVPRKLGFQLVREVRDERQAPGELGISCQWRLTRHEWDSPTAARLRPRPS